MRDFNPTGRQREVLALPDKGHFVVLGAAGSGKSIMALLRAEYLSKLSDDGCVLLVTFNGALAQHLQGQLCTLSENIVVEHYHKFARGYLNSRGKMARGGTILGQDKKEEIIRDVLQVLRQKHPEVSAMQCSDEFFIDEITFIQKQGIEDLDQYNELAIDECVESDLDEEERKWIFEVYDKYTNKRHRLKYKYDWDDIALYVCNELENDEDERRYSHIVIDEGQDFSPSMINSLIEAVAGEGSITFFADVAQQIYESRTSWRNSNLECSESPVIFDVNYRNQASILAFANDLIDSGYWIGDEDIIEAKPYIAEGQEPVLIECKSIDQEAEAVAKLAIARSKKASTAIICRTKNDLKFVNSIVKKLGGRATRIGKKTPGYANENKLYLSTFHSAKGLEFKYVFIPFLNEDEFPNPEAVKSASSQEMAFAEELKLLYVAATRAKFGLIMTYSGNLSPIFPEDSQNYNNESAN